MSRLKRDWRILPPMRVTPEIETEIAAAAEAAGLTVTDWRRVAYREALRSARRREHLPPPPRD